MSKEKVLESLQAIIRENKEEGVEEIFQFIEKNYGMVPFIVKVLSKRPDVLIAHVLKSFTIYRNEASTLDPKVKELIAIATASTLHCEFCLESHIERALKTGSTMGEVLETILIAGNISETSVHAHALRKFYQIDQKNKKKE
jgi:AhpD family alkylhydroperoxidase